ncbi:protein-arginine deiminase domain-containing protein [Streptomyces lanatus]|uniref:Protein-arginine deiminase domain-containing protein n=2 Tax=Streptomyces lanatus TaxID=66900 RepID=A0ABV1Y130_9ACTN|nr:protein-arginine deiminase domain-containing protein [Streptomyces lanatus]
MNRARARTATALAIALAVVSGTASAATAAGTGAVRADIRADVNRDGAVDVTGESDVAGKTAWCSGRGAIFLPNLGDRQRRCKTRTPDGRWLSNARLQACNDAQGNVVRAPEYLGQQAQDPLVLETGWLGIGHVDEFVQFLPADTPRGWKIGVADPEGGLALLRKAQRDGHGHTKVFSIPRSSADGRVPTIDQALSDRQLLKDKGGFAGFPGQRPAPAQDRPVGAYHPGAVNGVALTPTTYLAPKQWGPVIGGKDILAEAVTRAYAKAGMRVRYLDDWRTHHVFGGEVHCGTNTIRAAGTPWWNSPK